MWPVGSKKKLPSVPEDGIPGEISVTSSVGGGTFGGDHSSCVAGPSDARSEAMEVDSFVVETVDSDDSDGSIDSSKFLAEIEKIEEEMAVAIAKVNREVEEQTYAKAKGTASVVSSTCEPPKKKEKRIRVAASSSVCSKPSGRGRVVNKAKVKGGKPPKSSTASVAGTVRTAASKATKVSAASKTVVTRASNKSGRTATTAATASSRATTRSASRKGKLAEEARRVAAEEAAKDAAKQKKPAGRKGKAGLKTTGLDDEGSEWKPDPNDKGKDGDDDLEGPFYTPEKK